MLQVSRRYSDFDALHAALQLADVDLHLPPKKVFGNKDRMFVIERQRQLEVCSFRMLLNVEVVDCGLLVFVCWFIVVFADCVARACVGVSAAG